MATFAPDGRETCSGLAVCRTDASDLAEDCGPKLQLVDSERYVHVTPRGVQQTFVYASFRRMAENQVRVADH
jgi:hypothetical protein